MPSKYQPTDSCQRMVLLFSMSVCLFVPLEGWTSTPLFAFSAFDHEPLSDNCNSSLFLFPLSLFRTVLSTRTQPDSSFSLSSFHILVQNALPSLLLLLLKRHFYCASVDQSTAHVSVLVSKEGVRSYLEASYGCRLILEFVLFFGRTIAHATFIPLSFYFLTHQSKPFSSPSLYHHSIPSQVAAPPPSRIFFLFPFSFERYSSLIHKLNTVEGRAYQHHIRISMAATMTTAALHHQTQDYTEFVAAEGRYELLQDFHLDQVLPHPVIPTYVSSVSVKYKDYLNSSSSGGKKGTGVFGSVLDQLDEQLRDLKFSDDRAVDDAEEAAAAAAQVAGAQGNGGGGGGGGLQLSGNFHGNLVDLPLYNDETSSGAGGGGGGGKSPGGGGSSSLVSALTPPGPPPLKDSTSIGRLSDFSSSSTTTSHSNLVSGSSSSRTLGRASSFSHQLFEEGSAGAMSYQGGGGLSYSATIGPSSSTSSASGFSSFFAGKRKKPKSNIGKTNSTFVAKITTNENLAKILANRVNEDVYLFWNTGRTFTWSDLGQKPNVS